MPASPELELHDGLRAGGARVVGAHRADLLRERVRRRRREHVHRPAVRHDGRHAAECERLRDAEPRREVDDVARRTKATATTAPARRDHDVAARAAGGERDLGPVDLTRDAVDELHRRTGLLEVDHVVEGDSDRTSRAPSSCAASIPAAS